MTKRPLTDLAIRKIVPPSSGTVEVWDGKLPGFGVRVSPKGARSFVLLYRFAGRSRRLTLGRYPLLGLSEARRQAQQALMQVAQGIDPTPPPRAEVVPLNPLAFELVVAEFIARYARPKNKDWRETERLLHREFVPQWRARDVREITRSDAIAIIDEIVARGSTGTAIHVLAAVRRLFGWMQERDLIQHSPIQGIKPPGRIKARDRVLNDDELTAVWRSAGLEGYPFGTIIRLLILTGQRRGEVTGMRWSDLDFDLCLWSMSPELNKSGRPHVVPLTPTVIDLLCSLPRLHDRLVFPAHREEAESPVSGHSKSKERIDIHSGVANWTLHDIRRTVATGMARHKVSPHVVERVLNHSSGTFAGVAGVYNRFGYLDEMRAALESWERHVMTIALRDDRPNA